MCIMFYFRIKKKDLKFRFVRTYYLLCISFAVILVLLLYLFIVFIPVALIFLYFYFFFRFDDFACFSFDSLRKQNLCINSFVLLI